MNIDRIQEPVLPPYDTGMTKNQFDALRKLNQELYAASGFVHFGRHHSNNVTNPRINDGLYAVTDIANELRVGWSSYWGTPSAGASKTLFPRINIAGIIFDVSYLHNSGMDSGGNIKFPPAPDGKTTYNKSTGAVAAHSTPAAAFNAVANDPANVEVVTDRVDMWGFEAWLEEVTQAQPFVYPNGLIQSQATTMDGVATSASARPATYYAVFDGDTGSKGRGVNFFAQSDANKKKLLGDPANNLYFGDDGKLYQWRLRQRTIAGVGNGDWARINSVTDGSLAFTSSSSFVDIQGNQDLTLGVKQSATEIFIGRVSTWLEPSAGLFVGAKASGIKTERAANGECYFLVCGTVSRLNMGGYHPSFNPMGANPWKVIGQGTHGKWFAANSKSNDVTGMVDAFDFTNFVGNFSYIGQTNPSLIGRPDGRFYNAIYADGLGGVVDYRLSAWDKSSPAEAAKVRELVKSGKYRGLQKLVFSFIVSATPSTVYYSSSNIIKVTGYDDKSKVVGETPSAPNISGFTGYISVDGVIHYVKNIYYSISTNDWVFDLSNSPSQSFNGKPVQFAVITQPLFKSVSGNFLQTDVIGSPANILANPALANGWLGNWIPVVPDGNSKSYPYTRKALSFATPYFYTVDNGASWVAPGNMTALNPSDVTNSHFIAHGTNTVLIINYPAFSYQTAEANNTAVMNGDAGVFPLWQQGGFHGVTWGALLCESLIKKVMVSPAGGSGINSLSIIELTVRGDTGLISPGITSDYTSHQPISKPNPGSGASGVKTLPYQINSNGQASLNFAYQELKHDGADWGDNGKMPIIGGTSSVTDLNGATCVAGTATLAIPYGWVRNEV